MIANDILLDAFARVYESLHRTLADLDDDELTREPHPSIGWLAWRLTREMDSNVAQLSGGEQFWIADGWAARFGMPPEPADYGRSHTHQRDEVRAFRAPAKLRGAYPDAGYDPTKSYLKPLTAGGLARELDEPRFQPLPTVAVRLI